MERADSSLQRTLTREECFTLLAQVPVGRISVSIDALPVILPVHFAVADESILFRAVRGSPLDAATANAVVAFQADAPDPMAKGWWSVLLQGIATSTQDDEIATPWSTVSPWYGSETQRNERLLRIDARTIQGQLF
jgi:uncharacterized protein